MLNWNNTFCAKHPNRDSANSSEQWESMVEEISIMPIIDIESVILWLPDIPEWEGDDDKIYTAILSEYTINQDRIELIEIQNNASTKKERNESYKKIRNMWRYKHKTDAFLIDGYKKAKEFCDNNYWYFFVEGNLVFKDDNGIIWCINFDEKITRPPRYETVTRLQTWYEFISNIK
jgi:hypothetical protein